MSTKDDYVAAIKAAFVTMGDKAVESLLISYIPILGSPILSSILDYLVNFFMKQLVDQGEIAAFFVYTDFRVSAQGAAFTDAAMKNNLAQLNGTDQEKADAKKALWDAFRIFARLTS